VTRVTTTGDAAYSREPRPRSKST